MALEIIDAEGLEALSLERIAQEIGVRGPSLYHHFADKNEILTEVARLVLGDLNLDRDVEDWQEWMIENCLNFYGRVLEHPNAAAVLLEFMPDASTLPGFAKGARVLTDQGVDPSVQVLLMEGSEKIAWGWALQRAIMARNGDVRMSSTKINRRWPELALAVKESRWRDEQLLEASLRAFFAGVIEQTGL